MVWGSEVLWSGIVGGAANEILHWWGLRHKSELPEYVKSFFYWFITILMITIGGVVAQYQLGDGGEPFMAFQVGILAPLLLKKIASTAPDTVGSMGQKEINWLSFIKG